MPPTGRRVPQPPQPPGQDRSKWGVIVQELEQDLFASSTTKRTQEKDKSYMFCFISYPPRFSPVLEIRGPEETPKTSQWHSLIV